jgi:hypothetical protein
MASLEQFFDDDLLDVIFSNIRPPRHFDARRAAEEQTSDDARDRWLKRHTAQRKNDD